METSSRGLQITHFQKVIKLIIMSSLVCKVRKLDMISLAPLKNNLCIQLFQLKLSDQSLKASSKQLPAHPLDILTFLSS